MLLLTRFVTCFTLLIIVAMTSSAWGQLQWDQTQTTLTPMVAGDEAERDQVPTQLTATFGFQNTGQYAITVREVRAPKSWKVSQLQQTTYRPGQGDTLTVTLPVGTKREKITEEVLFYTDMSRQPLQRLTVTADLTQLPPVKPKQPKRILKIDPPFTMWTTEDAVEPKQVTIQILQDKPIEIAAFKPMALPQRTGRPKANTSNPSKVQPLGAPTITAALDVIEPGRTYRVTLTPQTLAHEQQMSWVAVDAQGQRVRSVPMLHARVIDREQMRQRVLEAKAKREAEQAEKTQVDSPIANE